MLKNQLLITYKKYLSKEILIKADGKNCLILEI